MARTRKQEQAPVAAAQRAAVLASKDSIVDEIVDADDRKEHGKVIPRDGVGKPTVMTKLTLSKLEYAFKIGCPDREAANYAGIGYATLTRYFVKHPEYREQTAAWKDDYLVAFARGNIAAAITGQIPKGDVAISSTYLRAKRKDEFAEKSIQEHQAVLTPAEIEAKATRELEGRKVIDVEAEDEGGGDKPTTPPLQVGTTPPAK